MIEKFKSNAEAIATADKYLYGNHARMPIVMDRGEGCWVWDLDNNKYLDFVGGIAVLTSLSGTTAFSSSA